MSFPKNKINIEVLLYALSQQLEPLPPDLQRSLTEIGQTSLANLTDENKIEIRELIAGYQPLEIVYRNALTQRNQNYVSQERTKSLGATFPIGSGLDELSILQGRGFANESLLLPANDWVAAAKQLVNNLNPPQTSAQFWDKTDRMAVTMAGGIAIGSAIAQLPGAIVGGALGAVYSWSIGFRKTAKQKYTNQNIDRSISSDLTNSNQSIDFYDIPTDTLAMMAQESTKDAVKNLHHKGISTHGMRDGIIYETGSGKTDR
jgi:hypothetical protein